MALYYPWMHFQDEAWLKWSLLVWGKIWRVRPPEVKDWGVDSDLIRQVYAESNLIGEISPSRKDLEEVERMFLATLGEYTVEDYLRHNMLCGNKLSIHAPGSNEPPWARREDGLFWFYVGEESIRMTQTLRNELFSRGLASERVGYENPAISGPMKWIGLTRELGAAYACGLAEVIAQHNQLSLVTDSPDVHVLGGALDRLAELVQENMEGVRPSSELSSQDELKGLYGHLAMKLAIRPSKIEAVSVGRLLAFRERYEAELAAFWAHVDSLSEALESGSEIDNYDVLYGFLEETYRRETEPLLNDLRKALRGLGVETTVGTLTLRVDQGTLAAGTSLGALALTDGQPLVLRASAVMVLGVVPYALSQVNALREKKAKSPVAYLLAANRRFGGIRRLGMR